MHRRDFLTAAPAVLLAATAGCLGDASDDTVHEDAAGDIDCQPVSDYGSLEAYPRTDEPPHTIVRPKGQDGTLEPPDAWNNDYLGECLRREPSLEFSVLDGTGPPPLRPIDDRPHPSRLDFDDGGSQFWTALVTDADDRQELFDLDEAEPEWRRGIEDVELGAGAIVLVESGFRSGERPDRWVRADPRDEVVHLHGYVYSPFETTDDIATHFSVVEIDLADAERPGRSMVSLTISEDRRVNFDSTEGVVSL